WHNPYLLAALLSGLLAWLSKNVLLTTVVGMGSFLLLKLVVLA
ncbi:TPA: AzlD domain-containing protein, partial [Vibrio cholerae]|nr:AzlD domain-containing protein [Vibrio cholerae]HDV5563672.1 AzlD domain-containing protein [Vibrio cholerae]